MSKLLLLIVLILLGGVAWYGWQYIDQGGTVSAIPSFGATPSPTFDVTDRTTVTDPNSSPDPVNETGPETTCTADADCRCRLFTGAEFIPGSSVSQCCQETNGFNCPTLNHCARCLYS